MNNNTFEAVATIPVPSVHILNELVRSLISVSDPVQLARQKAIAIERNSHDFEFAELRQARVNTPPTSLLKHVNDE